MNRTLSSTIVIAGLAIGFMAPNALGAVSVTIKGFVADLTGTPHDDRPDITVRIRSLKSNNEIVTQKVRNDGSFSIEIPPDRIPPEDVTLSITADGTTFIKGVLTRVRTNGQLVGLAGLIDSKDSKF